MDDFEYFRTKQHQLNVEVSGKTKIYLDTKYWLIFRDIRLGRCRLESDKRLYERITSMVEAGEAVCPFSAEILFELCKQADQETQKETIRVIDQLSGRTCLIPLLERVKLEIKSLLYQTTQSKASSDTRHNHMFTRAGYVHGFLPTDAQTGGLNLSDCDRKSLIDFTWDISLTRMTKDKTLNDLIGEYIPDNVADTLNQGKFEHADQHNSYSQMYLSELAGTVDLFSPQIELAWTEFCAECGEEQSDSQLNYGTETLRRILFNGTKKDKLRTTIPTIHILASIHAITRWDKARVYKENDFSDFNHAVFALPYCDYFFTERSLSTLVNRAEIGSLETYSCVTESKSYSASLALDHTGQ